LELKVADLVRDGEILKQAQEDAAEILDRDLSLKNPEHQGLRARLKDLYQKRWSSIDLA
jgi:RecG-like helicase